MPITITHLKVSAIADDPAAEARGEVLPSDWNAEHTLVGSIAWGEITGALTDQTDLQTALDAKANASGVVLKSDYSPAHSILVQQSGTGSPTALQVSNNTLVGRLSGGGSAIDDLTGTQVTTLLDVFTTSLKGVVPASGGGTTNFLRADGTWAAPSSALPSGTVIVNFGAYSYAVKISVADVAITATSKVMVSLAAPTAPRDADELEFSPINVAAVVNAGVGFDIYATAPIGADGQFNVNYLIGEY
jgi:hypothetical protein